MPVQFTRVQLYDLMEQAWPYISKAPLRNHFPTTAVWAQFTRKHNSNEKTTSTIVSTRITRIEYNKGVKENHQTTRWAVHLPAHYAGHGGSQ